MTRRRVDGPAAPRAAGGPPGGRGDGTPGPRAPESEAARARRVAGAVPDPELPVLTLADLGVLRSVEVSDPAPDGAGRTVTVTLTPTYSGCPAVAEMRACLDARLRAAGFPRVEVRTALSPPWTSAWISATGRRKLAEHGIAPPLPAPQRPAGGPVPLELGATRRAVRCPNCGSPDTAETARFAATACRALWRCRSCREPFEYFKEI